MRGILFFLFKKLYRLLSNKGLEKVPGTTRAFTFLLQRLRPRGISLAKIQGIQMYINADYNLGGVLWLIIKDYEKWETELVKEIISEGMTVADIGANVGYYSLIAAKLVGNNGKVYAFEPEPENYELLVRNIEINGYTNVVPVNKAVSNECGKTKLFINRVSSSRHSFSQNNVTDEAGSVEVEIITLDEFFKGEKVDFIKMDVEGAEGLILDGARQILSQDRLTIIMEFWPTGLNNLGTDPLGLLCKLQKIGFTIKLIDKTTRFLQPAEIIEIIELRNKELGEDSCGTHVYLLLEK